MKTAIHFQGQINFFTTEKGGLVNPVSSGFRSEIRFPFELKSYIAAQTFTETELIFPGDTTNIDITLIDGAEFLDKLYKGMDFELYDKSVLVAEGVITAIYV